MNHQNKTMNNKVSSMRNRVTSLPILLLTLVATLAMVGVGCTTGGDPVIRVQTNLVPKTLFDGEWWVNQTVLAADGEATAEGPTYSFYPGGSGWSDYALDRGQSGVISRIRWVIDEDFLYAYRSYEIIDGGNDDGNDDDFRGQPLAAYAIDGHIDVRTQYSGLTGEQTNVIVENTSDRRWYERDYMRINWSHNHVNSFNFLVDDITLGGGWQMESVPFFIPNADSHDAFPSRYAPQFVTVGNDPDYRFRHEWPEGSEDIVHYMSFTTMTLFSPGQSCFFQGGGRCNTLAVPMRTAFLRIPENHDFASQQQSHPEFDRFGLFRTYQRTYVRGGSQEITCESDNDCGANGFCRQDVQLCSGLASDYGETDFLNFLRPTHNIFRDGLTETTCGADFQCTTPGSECDGASQRCTIPVAEREINQVKFTLNEGYPAYLTHSAYEVLGNWNETFMRGWRAARNMAVPDYRTGTPIACQNDNPTAYCFCGSPDDLGAGSCNTEFNPFISPAEYTALGIADPFDCVIQNASGFVEPVTATSYDQWNNNLPAAYDYEFVGSECIFILESNKCDLVRTDVNENCEELTGDNGEPLQWQQHGDIRYQFFNFIHQTGSWFGGLSEVRADAVTGELLASDANFASGVVESMTRVANEWFPVLRCRNPDLGCAAGEEGSDVRYLEGENIREYFENVGRIEIPVSVAGSGGDGTGSAPEGRPDMPAGAGQIPAGNALRDTLLQSVVDRIPRIEQLHGEDARFNIHSDRMGELAGSNIERTFMESMGNQVMHAGFSQNAQVTGLSDIDPTASPMDADVVDRISPFRGSQFLRQFSERQDFANRLAARGACFTNLIDGQDFQRSRYWEYWAEAYRDVDNAQASIQMQQLQLRSVMHHEMGHSVGLRHNFGGSLDRNNFGDGYFNLTVEQGMAIPELEDYDQPALGGNNDTFVGGSEVETFRTALNEVRDQRARAGAHNYMTASIMDYNGDMSDSYGLGRYDQAAILWSHFARVEAYEGDPRIDSETTTNDLHNTHTAARTLWASYQGGQSCQVDLDCGYHGPTVNADGDPVAASPLLPDGQIVSQRCVQNRRNTRFQVGCGEDDTQCACSAFDVDFDDYRTGSRGAPNNDVNDDGVLDHFPVRYLFCTDDRTNDISWCNRFDVGESFQESIANYRRTWYEGYANNYNRRFRGVRTAASWGSIIAAAKIYQHLFFRIFFEPGFTSNDGPLGFTDQFLASVDSMNWFMELVNLPDEGSYEEIDGVLRHVSDELDAPGSDVSLGAGQGFQMWTEFQTGHQGFFRAQKGGVFFDKYLAMYALAVRDWGLNFTADERYFLNYYDLFEVPVTEFFGGIITDQPSWYAPRYHADEDRVEHMSWYRGLLLGECRPDGLSVPCRPSQEEVYPITDAPAIGGTTNVILRSWATILALAQFPVFYDASFEQRLIIWKHGDGIGHDLADTYRDRVTGVERPSCAYGAFAAEPGHVTVGGDPTCVTTEDATYAVYESDRLHFAYIAEKVYTRDSFTLEEEQLGFQMLSRLIDLQNEVRALELAGPSADLDRTRIALFENESYLEYMIDLQAQYGISNYFF